MANIGTTDTFDYICNMVYKNNQLQYMLHEEGRVRPQFVAEEDTFKYVYDYFIKDHLGNVRTTISASPMSALYFARHEIASSGIEHLLFDNIPAVRVFKPGSYNPNDNKAAQLVAADSSRRIGTAIMLRVMPGDRFDISAKSFYEENQPNNNNQNMGTQDMINSLFQTLSGGSTLGGVPLQELPQNMQILQQAFGVNALANINKYEAIDIENNNDTIPKGFLNILLFDEQLRLLGDSRRIQIPLRGSGGTADWSSLSVVDGLSIAIPGYMITYISNESIGRDVWFDDISISNYRGAVIDEHFYYPFGLTISSSGFGVEQPYKYNGKELEKKFGLEWYSYGAREYDPQIGRFPTIDRFAGNFASMSPYHYASNNPISNIDINGDSTWTTTNAVKNANGTTTTTYTTHITGKVLDLAGVKQGGGCNVRSGTRDLARDINRRFNGQKTANQLPNGNQEIWNFDVNYTVAGSMADVSASDHLLVVVDDVTGTADPELGGGGAGGLADINGKVAYVENTSSFNFLVENSVHEIGHNMGEKHTANGTGNFMSYDQSRREFTGLQIMQMYNRSNNGALNQGSNSQRSIINTNNWLYNTSSDIAPWFKNTSVGDRIPKTLDN